MMQAPKTARAIVLTMATMSIAACGDAPTNPSPGVSLNQLPAPVPPTPTEPTLAGVEIQGPDVLLLGQTLQYALIARFTDGTQRDVTNEGRWSPGWGDAVALEAPGQLRGSSAGENQVEASFDRHSTSKTVIVLPAGTYRLRGRIVEAGFPDDGVVGATVEARSGSRQVIGTTDLYGVYRLYGVAGPTTLHVTKPGYERTEQTVVVDDHQDLTVTLPIVAPRAEVGGTYTLTITAARACAVGDGEGALPEDARRRTYEATVTQNGPALSLVLTGDSLFRGRSDIRGWIEPHRIVFDLNWTGWEPWLITEQLAPSRWLLVDGVGVVNPSASGLSGRFGGHLMVTGSADGGTPTASCTSADHGFSLTR